MNTALRTRLLPAIVFLALWCFHLHSAGGALVPYRDTGEMVTNAQTLGIAHPPGYPLYILLGKISTYAFPGNPSYRVNLLSALASALAGTVLYFLLAVSGGTMAGICGALFWATSPIFWEASSLSEMYTVGIVFVILIFVLMRRASVPWALVAFLWGASLGVRTDYLLLAPAFLLLMARRKEWGQVPLSAGFFFLGLFVFLYMPLRSAQQPWVDWNNPEVISNFIGSLLRRSHGGTLDLLSRNYQAGENFMSEMVLFLKNSGGAFTWLGLPLAALGLRRLYGREKDFFHFLLLNFVLFGPVFIYLANMPPNSHAVAIVEAHYIVPQLIFLIWAVEGLRSMGDVKLFHSAASRAVAAALVVALVGMNAAAHRGRGDKRWNFYGRDATINTFRSAVPNSIGIVREDVPLFALWEKTLVSRRRLDVTPVGQGLSASPWYHEMLAHAGQSAALGKLAEPGDWARLLRDNPGRPVWISGDANYNGAATPRPWGMVSYLSGPPFPAEADPLRDFCVVRGDRRQDRRADFFSSNILSNYARAMARRSSLLLGDKKWDETESALQWARTFDPEFPTAAYHLGFVAFQKGDYARAEWYDAEATRLFEKLFDRARYYKSLPDVVDGLRQEAGDVWVHRGVLAEKRSDLDAARRCYGQAIALNPRSAQAHYNLAVTFWNRDWTQAAAHMEKAAALDPQNPQYRAYLERARRLQMGKVP